MKKMIFFISCLRKYIKREIIGQILGDIQLFCTAALK